MNFKLETTVLLAIFSLEVFGGNIPRMEDLPLKESKNLLKITNNNEVHMRNSNGHQERELVPNFLPTGFHDFVSSDQGPTYSYDSLSRTPKFRNRLHQSGAYNRYHALSAGYFYNPEYRSTTDALKRMEMPFPLHPKNMDGYDYPVPEDRLPPVLMPLEKNEEQSLDTEPEGVEAKKNRTARFVRNFLDSKSNVQSYWPWNRRNDVGYRPQNDIHMLFSNMKNIEDRGDQYIEDHMDYDPADYAMPMPNHDPLALMVAATLPLTMMLAAVLPVLIKFKLSALHGGSGNVNVPLVTTTATGNRSSIFDFNDALFLDNSKAKFGPRNNDDDENDCFVKVFCKVVNTDEFSVLPLPKILSDMTKYIHGSWLETFGLKTFIESVKDGKCEDISCSIADPKSKKPK